MAGRLVAIGCLLALVAAGADEKKARAPKQDAQSKQESMTGCLDQRGEAFFLAGSGMKEEAKLSGKAFSDDNFARYIGHRVTVRGSVDRSSSPMVIQVVKIDDVAETCR